MKEILDKISSYNFFNYLFPGFIYSTVYEHFYEHKIVEGDIIIQLFIAYLIGMVISRFGSLFIEPFLRKIKFLKFATYQEFVLVEKDDPKLEILSEVKNTYRTLTSMFLLFIVTICWHNIVDYFSLDRIHNILIILFILLFLFLFSYRKQTNYITSRIKSLINNNTNRSQNNNLED